MSNARAAASSQNGTILIAGAGPTGMTMAIELARAGLPVRLIDRSDHAALHSQALVVQARTLEQFQRYGIAANAVARGRELKRASIRSEGKTIVSLSFDRIPSRYPFLLFLPQSETEALLNERLESFGVTIERGVELVSFSDRGDGVDAVLRHPDRSEEHLAARWLIGCDGAHSDVRTRAGIPFEGRSIGLSFFLADAEVDGPDAPHDELFVNTQGGEVVFMGRLSDTVTRVIVASDGTAHRYDDREPAIEDFQAAIDRAGLRVRMRSASWMTPFHVNDRQAQHYRAGSVFLAGDASHIHSPVGGQGMNTGIQDAANLGWKLAAVARGADAHLLDSYEEERAAVGKALLTFTERGLGLAIASGFVVEHLRSALLPLVSSLAPVQNAVAGFISETAIDYRSSSIVSDRGGDGSIRAGDRLPDVTLGNGGSLLCDFTDATHLALLLAGTDADADDVKQRLPRARVVTLSPDEFDERGRALLGIEQNVFIVRPDGYLGFRGPLDARAALDAYAAQDALA